MNDFEAAATFLKKQSVPAIAELYRHLSGLEMAVSLMGLDPHKLSEFALSENDGLWRNLALRSVRFWGVGGGYSGDSGAVQAA